MKSAVLRSLERSEKLFEENGLTYVGLFGSHSRGEATEKSDSDVDILFDYGRPISLFDVASIKISLEKSLGREVDLISRRALKPQLKKYIEQDLETVYEKG